MLDRIINWYSNQSPVVKILSIVFVIVAVVLLLPFVKKGNKIYTDFGFIEMEEEKIKYEIEKQESVIIDVDKEIKENIENEKEQHNAIDTFDSFDDVYNHIVGDRED